MTREYTNKLTDAMDQGLISGELLATILMQYMSESEVEGACRNMPDLDFIMEEEEEEPDYDDIVISMIGWDDTDIEGEEITTDLPETIALSLVNELLTSGSEYDEQEIGEWMEEKYNVTPITFAVTEA